MSVSCCGCGVAVDYLGNPIDPSDSRPLCYDCALEEDDHKRGQTSPCAVAVAYGGPLGPAPAPADNMLSQRSSHDQVRRNHDPRRATRCRLSNRTAPCLRHRRTVPGVDMRRLQESE